jgi:hypothetical protein
MQAIRYFFSLKHSPTKKGDSELHFLGKLALVRLVESRFWNLPIAIQTHQYKIPKDRPPLRQEFFYIEHI